MPGYHYFYGSNWLLYVGLPLIIAAIAQFRVSSAFAKYSRIRASSNMTGAEVASDATGWSQALCPLATSSATIAVSAPDPLTTKTWSLVTAE